MIEEFYKKKLIRDFLSLFSESKWKELLFLSIEYGILFLKRNYNVAALSLDDLTNIVDELKEEENKRHKQTLKKYEMNLNRDRDKNFLVLTKPSSDWRKGDETKFETKKNRKEDNLISNHNTELEKFLYDKKRKKEKENYLNLRNSDSFVYPHWWGEVKDFNKDRILKSKTFIRDCDTRRRRSENNRSSVQNKSYHKDRNIELIPKNLSKLPRSASHDLKSRRRTNINNRENRMNVDYVESKIKNRVETDKKIYSMLNKIPSNHSKTDYDYNYDYDDDKHRNIKNEIDYDIYGVNQDRNQNHLYDQNNRFDKNIYRDEFAQIDKNKMKFENYSAKFKNEHDNNSVYSEKSIKNNYKFDCNNNNYIPHSVQRDKNNLDQSLSVDNQETTPKYSNEKINSSNFTIYQPYDRTNTSEKFKNGNLNYARNIKNSESESIKSVKTDNTSDYYNKNRSNYIIEFDKRLNPQIIKEKNKKVQEDNEKYTKIINSPSEGLYDNNTRFENNRQNYELKHFPNNHQDIRSAPKEPSGNFFQNNKNDGYKTMPNDSVNNSRSSNRKNEDAILKEQMHPTYYNNNKFRTETDDTYKLSASNNTMNADLEINSINYKNPVNTNRSNKPTENTDSNFMASLRSKQDNCENSSYFRGDKGSNNIYRHEINGELSKYIEQLLLI